MSSLTSKFRSLDVKSLPTYLKDDMPAHKQVRLIKGALTRDGWRILPPWPWVNAYVRATRNGIGLNLIIHEPRFLRIETVLFDAREAVANMQAQVVVLTRSYVCSNTRDSASRVGLHVVSPEQLEVIEHLIRVTSEANTQTTSKQVTSDQNTVNGNKESTAVNCEGSLPACPLKSAVGFIEAFERDKIWGWVYTPDIPTLRLRVEVYQGSTFLASAAANEFRADLLNARIGDGGYGFILGSAGLIGCNILDLTVVACFPDGVTTVIRPTQRLLTRCTPHNT